MSSASEPDPSGHASSGEMLAERIDAHGDGVGALEGDALAPSLAGIETHVPGLLPGERGRVQVVAHARRARPPRAHAHLLERLAPHPRRREAPCARHWEAEGRCSGCPLMTLDLESQAQLKAQRVEEAVGRPVDAFIPAPREFGYRHSAKRVVGGRRGALVFGSYLRGEHRVADMAGCRVDHPAIVEALAALRRAANALEVTAYRAPSRPGGEGSGALRYVWAKTDGSGVLLTLIAAVDDRAAFAALAAHPELTRCRVIVGVAWSVQADTGNAVRGTAAELLRGSGELRFPVLDDEIRVGPLGFVQPNPQVAAMAYEALLGKADGEVVRGELAFDLYAGAGVTTRRLGRNFERVRPCEAYPESAAALGVEASRAEDFVAEAVREKAQPELVIANPPRAGFGASTCAALLELGAPRLHIMSCNPDSLARDLERLSPAYEVEGVRAYDTLPQTAHVECVVWLRRRGASSSSTPQSD